MQQVGFGVFFLYPLFVYSCPTSLVKKPPRYRAFIGGMGPVQKAMGRILFYCFKAWGGYFFAVSSHGSDTFFHYLEANEKIFTEENAVAAIVFTKIAESD